MQLFIVMTEPPAGEAEGAFEHKPSQGGKEGGNSQKGRAHPFSTMFKTQRFVITNLQCCRKWDTCPSMGHACSRMVELELLPCCTSWRGRGGEGGEVGDLLCCNPQTTSALSPVRSLQRICLCCCGCCLARKDKFLPKPHNLRYCPKPLGWD